MPVSNYPAGTGLLFGVKISGDSHAGSRRQRQTEPEGRPLKEEICGRIVCRTGENMKILGFHCQGNEICCSDGSFTKDDYLGFLLKYSDSINVCYNLDWFVARLVYLLGIPETQIRKFWDTSKLFHLGHAVFFVPHRYLHIKYGKYFGQAAFSDVYQYDNSLPFDVDPLDAARKAQEIGQRVYDVLTSLNLAPTSLSSPISAIQKEILSTVDLPTYKDNPPEVNLYAHEALHGGLQEAYKVGHFDRTWDFDINSAFPFWATQLPDLRRGRWVKSEKFSSKPPMGYCRTTTVVEKDFNPIIHTCDVTEYTAAGKETRRADFTPTGERPVTLTNARIRQMYDYDLGRSKILSAWYWLADGPIQYPYKELIETLYGWKEYYKGFERMVIKRALVGIIGKLGETFKEDFGKICNWPYYAWIHDQTKGQCAQLVIENHAEDDLLSIAVDGCLFKRDLGLQDGTTMGSWRLNTSAPAFVVSSGIGCIQGKEASGQFALHYDWLKEQISQNPGASEYVMQKKTPITIGYALKFGKLDKLGELETTERAVVLQDSKRMWIGYPQTGGDLMKQYHSLALDMSVLQARAYTE